MGPARLHDLSEAREIPSALLERTEADLSGFATKVAPIIESVRREGDAALRRFARELDGVAAEPMTLRAEPAEFDAAFERVPRDVVRAIEHAIDNIRRFHEAQLPEEMWLKQIEPGIWTGERYTPIDSVACYVPRGKGSFPSVVNMTAIPGRVAGVPRLVILTPPGADVIDPGVPAGPSESIVLADDSADGALAALDLLIEAEHGADSSAFLVTPSRRVATEAQAALQRYWGQMQAQRAAFSHAVLTGEHGGIVLTHDFDAAIEFANAYAPEHMAVLVAEPMAVLPRLRNAGEILLGRYSAISLGNYLLGPNAVLPTGGRAKTASPLSVFDFLKRTSVAYVTRDGYGRVAPDTLCLARYEGFDAHARAVSAARAALLGD